MMPNVNLTAEYAEQLMKSRRDRQMIQKMLVGHENVYSVEKMYNCKFLYDNDKYIVGVEFNDDSMATFVRMKFSG